MRLLAQSESKRRPHRPAGHRSPRPGPKYGALCSRVAIRSAAGAVHRSVPTSLAELIEQGFIKSLADGWSVRSWSGCDRCLPQQSIVHIILVPLGMASIFGAAVGQYPAEPDLVLIIE